MTLEQKRELDAKITKKFLHDNEAVIKRIVTAFGTELNSRLPAAYRYYLKGGNAISLLKGEATTGDFDFQVMPPVTDYDNWPAAFANFDAFIIISLKEALNHVADEAVFNVQAFTVPQLRLMAAQAPAVTGDSIPFDRMRQVKRRNMMMRIGARYNEALRTHDDTYGNKTCLEIMSNQGFVNGRLTLGREYISSTDIEPDKGPMVYVNYSIPGFLLYRMVYSFEYVITYQDGTVEHFSLKSEIIDVSVPRKGSAEVCMSQDGIITHFRKPADVSYDFFIPGWGYHFYENINLLQEIELGKSGSIQKKQKRILRGTEAMNQLSTTVPKRLTAEYIEEKVSPTEKGVILAYFGTLIYNVNDLSQFHQGRAVYDSQMIQAMRTTLLSEGKKHFETAMAGRIKDKWLSFFVQFRLKTTYDIGLRTITQVKEGFGALKRRYNNTQSLVAPQYQKMLNERTFQFISPYTGLLPEGVFPMDYVVINVIQDVFGKLFDYCMIYEKKYVKAHNQNAFMIAVHGKCVFYLLVQNCGRVLPQADEHLEELLQLSILESQRYGLAAIYEKPR